MEHHRPVGRGSKTRLIGFFVGAAGLRRHFWMGVNPDSRELSGLPPRIDLLVKEFGHRRVVELDRDDAAELLDRLDVLDIEKIIKPRDAEATDLAHPAVAEKQQLGPGRGTESERRRRPPAVRLGTLLRLHVRPPRVVCLAKQAFSPISSWKHEGQIFL